MLERTIEFFLSCMHRRMVQEIVYLKKDAEERAALSAEEKLAYYCDSHAEKLFAGGKWTPSEDGETQKNGKVPPQYESFVFLNYQRFKSVHEPWHKVLREVYWTACCRDFLDGKHAAAYTAIEEEHLLHYMPMLREMFYQIQMIVENHESDLCFEGPSESEMMADVFAKLIRKLKLGPIALAGGSHGSRVSLICASRNPDLVSHLALWWISGGPVGLMQLATYYCGEAANEASRVQAASDQLEKVASLLSSDQEAEAQRLASGWWLHKSGVSLTETKPAAGKRKASPKAISKPAKR